MSKTVHYFTNDEHLWQAGWFLRPDCASSSECPQFADLWSESAEWCGRNISGSAHLCRRLPLHAASTVAARYDRREVAGMANFNMHLLHQFCSNGVEFFYNTQETQTPKMMDQNFEIQFVIFENFLKFSKRRRVVIKIGQRWNVKVPVRDTQTHTDRQSRQKNYGLQVCNPAKKCNILHLQHFGARGGSSGLKFTNIGPDVQ